MKGEPAPELGCCHKTKPLGSTADSLSPHLDSQLCQDVQVRWGSGPISEPRMLLEGGEGRKWGEGGSEGTWILLVLSTSTPAPHKNVPSEVPETCSYAPGPDSPWDMRRDRPCRAECHGGLGLGAGSGPSCGVHRLS